MNSLATIFLGQYHGCSPPVLQLPLSNKLQATNNKRKLHELQQLFTDCFTSFYHLTNLFGIRVRASPIPRLEFPNI